MSTDASEVPRLDPIGPIDPIAAVEAWRAQGAAQVDPVGLRVIEGLARRAAAHQGEAQQRLILRIEELLARHAAAKPPARRAATAQDERDGKRAALAGLAELVDRLGRSPTSRVPPPSSPPSKGATRQNDTTRTAPLSQAAPPAPRKNAVTAF